MRYLCAMVAAMGCAASAYAIDIPADQVSSSPIDGAPGYVDRDVSPVYTAVNGPYGAFAAAAGSLGFDDYTSTVTDAPSFALARFSFVGGVAAAGTVRVEFFDAQNVLANQFTVNLPAGNNIWNIDLAPIPEQSTFIVPSIGVVQITTIQGVTGAPAVPGQWFLSATPPSVGTQSASFGSTAGTASAAFSHRFALNAVPTPGALALAGMGGVLMTRRRRA